MEASPQARPFAVKAIREFFEPPIIFVKKDDLESVIEILGSDHGLPSEAARVSQWHWFSRRLEERERACATLVAGRNPFPDRQNTGAVSTDRKSGMGSAVACTGKRAGAYLVGLAGVTFCSYFVFRLLLSEWKNDTFRMGKWWCDKNAAVFQFIGEDNVYFYGPAEMAMFLGLQGRQPEFPPPTGQCSCRRWS